MTRPLYNKEEWDEQIEADQVVAYVLSAINDLEEHAKKPRFAPLLARETIHLRDSWIKLGNALSEITKRKLGEAA